MQRYLLSRLLQSLLLMAGVLVIVFFMVRLTGDPASLLINRDFANPEQMAAMRAAFGLDKPVHLQFVDYMSKLLTGDFGYSLRFRQPALDVILSGLPITVLLASLALMLAVVVAVPLGVIGGTAPNSPVDFAARVIGLAGQVTPSFWLALILIWVFAVNLRWLPSFGIDSARAYVLPALALSVGGMGQLARLTRSAVLEIRSEDYIRTARSKGLSPRHIAAHHVTRNAALALVSVIGVQFTYALSGSVYIETIFAIPGMGWMLNEAIRNRDFVLVQALTIFIASFAIVMNLVTDILYAVIDPRIRY
jgi:ABC-type dipeptide/oligopeptide/nickel transport system permease component